MPLIRAGWVHHSLIFGHADYLREVAPEMIEPVSEMSTVPIDRATFNFFWFEGIQMIFCRD
jgi:hypothetical protein